MAKKTEKSPIRVNESQAVDQTKRSIIVHKKEEPIENLYQALGEAERTIQELSRILAEMEPGRHKGVGGAVKLTTREEVIVRELEEARKRAKELIYLIKTIRAKGD